MDKDAPRRVARRAARQVESSTVARRLARTGFVASGVMHALVGVLALAVAFGGEEDTDQTGALRAVAAAPAGFIGLWLIATALFTLGVWHLVGGVLDRDREGGRGGVGEEVGSPGDGVGAGRGDGDARGDRRSGGDGRSP